MTTQRQTPEKDDREKQQPPRDPSPDRPFERTERPHPGADRTGETERPQRQGSGTQPARR
jgi:hypothetical protein